MVPYAKMPIFYASHARNAFSVAVPFYVFTFGCPTLLELRQQIQRSDAGDLSHVCGAKEKQRGKICFGQAHLAA